ncbi:MAG TPA: ATP-binding protein [Kofleriaceae bacterium]|nr:ATP-binding protein [Kofleriaceae bacterium]
MGDDGLLSGAIDQLPLGVWIARAPTGELLLANQMFRDIMGTDARADVAVGGYSEPYGIYRTDGQLYPEAELPFGRALAARTTVTVDDIVIHRGDGSRVHVRAHARPVFDGDVITHVVIAFADITAEREAEQRRRTAEAGTALAHRLEALGNLAAGVAHDFNNMLAQIRVLASLLRMREGDPTRVADLHRIEEATDRAAALTRSLLAFGRHPSSRNARVDLDEVVAAVVDLVRRTFDRHITIDVVTAGPGANVVGDRNQLEQAVMNLALNAREAMPRGGRLGFRIAVEDLAAPPAPLAPGRHVVVEVSDSGPGVPVELRPRIFEPYFTTKLDRESPGTGLGLATTYGVIQAHGGAIEVGDAAPHGARFTIMLPYDASQPVAAPPAGRRPLVAGSGLILLVDDEDGLRRSVRRAIERMGYQVIEAADGAAAVAVFRERHRELAAVVIDHVMPAMSGRDAFMLMHAIDPGVPVVLTSGRLDTPDQEELTALGLGAVLPKPFDVVELSSALSRLAER